jgi:hypothetical protein
MGRTGQWARLTSARVVRAAIAASALVLLTAVPVLGHPEYHYQGAVTTSRYDGVYGWIETVDTGARPDTMDFIANRVMAKKLEGNPSGQAWIEIGWAEVGWANIVNGWPDQMVYVYDTVHYVWHFYGSVCTGAGCHIDVRIVPGSSCTIGASSCTWYAQRWNHSTSVWQTLHSITLPMDRAYVEQFTEVNNDGLNPAPGHLAVDYNNNDMDWLLTQRRFSNGSWLNWSSANTGTSEEAPYCINWYANYSEWTVRNGGC